ncbi:MAG TPA: peptidylprolyl isomerase [Thermoanaerobaculia bacterium]|nr:peptidylprolyl isomerase [Thermoanaerobaculia bacterium]
MKKTTSILMALALSAAVAVAQQKQASPAAGEKSADPVIITAGDLTVRQSEFEAALRTLPSEYQAYAMGPGKRQFAEDFLRMKILAREGLKGGLDKDPEVVAQLNLLRENLIAQAALKKIDAGITITDDDLKKTYEANKDEYEQVKARHILVAFKGSPAAQPGKKELSEEEAKAKAEELRKKIVAGADFAEVAKAESDDTGSGSRGGELGAFGRGQMVQEFEAAAFAAKVGEIPPVVKTQFGYHVIRVDEHSMTPFDQVRETLEKNERQKKLQQALDAMKTGANPKFDDTYFATPAAEAKDAAPKAAEKKQ